MSYKKTVKAKEKSKIYPSNCGSHKSMLVTEGNYGEFNDKELNSVYCEDEHGIYVTTRTSLDNGLCDFNRTVDDKHRNNKLKEFNTTIEVPNK